MGSGRERGHWACPDVMEAEQPRQKWLVNHRGKIEKSHRLESI